ncbi:MAG: hypothetical protein ABI559_07520 [Chloroflexota bacterium]
MVRIIGRTWGTVSDSLRNGLIAFATAAAAVIVVSLVIILATSGGGSNTSVDDPSSVTPAVLGDTATPPATATITP